MAAFLPSFWYVFLVPPVEAKIANEEHICLTLYSDHHLLRGEKREEPEKGLTFVFAICAWVASTFHGNKLSG